MTTAKPTRVDAKKSYATIMQAARQLFYQHGAAIGLEEIVQQSGVSRATFFRHFANREQLMIALTDEGRAYLEQQAVRIKQQHTETLPPLLELIIEHIIQNMAVFEYWWIMATPNHQMSGQVQQLLEEIFDDALKNAILCGRCRPDLTSRDIFLFGRMLVGAALREPPTQRAEVVRRAAGLLLIGFGLE